MSKTFHFDENQTRQSSQKKIHQTFQKYQIVIIQREYQVLQFDLDIIKMSKNSI